MQPLTYCVSPVTFIDETFLRVNTDLLYEEPEKFLGHAWYDKPIRTGSAFKDEGARQVETSERAQTCKLEWFPNISINPLSLKKMFGNDFSHVRFEINSFDLIEKNI